MKLKTAIALKAYHESPDDTLTHDAYKNVMWGIDEDTGEIIPFDNPKLSQQRKKYREIFHEYHEKHVVGGIVAAQETIPDRITDPNKRIVKVGTQFCIQTDGVDNNQGCWPSKKQAQDVANGKSFITSNMPDNLYAGGPGSGRHASGSDKQEKRKEKALRVFNRIYKLARQAGLKDNDARQAATEAYMHAFQTVSAGGPGSGRKPSVAKGLNKWKSRDEEIAKARKDPNQMKLPLKAESMEYGEPMAGALQHAHMDTNLWFHPPSLAKKGKETHIPADNPGEKNDKFLDVTKRKSKETSRQRMDLLKKSAPGGLPAQIPVRTTLVSPVLPAYSPLYASAGRQRRRNGGGMFRAYGAAKI